ncbi:hypothetical protein ACFU7T_08150 [Streptomyces sp. NPDC057555]|uniref:hypothetical protein n=1 Tax=Streptomyces sp. NPDC057555 TaxID=3346166 RepID=UPI003692903E
MRLIDRKERPHPGAQLRVMDADGKRITCFATNTPGRPIAKLELRHRLRDRAQDRTRAARSTGLRTHHWPRAGEITTVLERLALLPSPD